MAVEWRKTANQEMTKLEMKRRRDRQTEQRQLHRGMQQLRRRGELRRKFGCRCGCRRRGKREAEKLSQPTCKGRNSRQQARHKTHSRSSHVMAVVCQSREQQE